MQHSAADADPRQQLLAKLVEVAEVLRGFIRTKIHAERRKNSHCWWHYPLWIMASGVGVGFGCSAFSALYAAPGAREILPGLCRAMCGLDSSAEAPIISQSSTPPAGESSQRWRVPQPDFFMPMLQWLGPLLDPDPDYETTMEMDEMLWEDMKSLHLYTMLLEEKLIERVRFARPKKGPIDWFGNEEGSPILERMDLHRKKIEEHREKIQQVHDSNMKKMGVDIQQMIQEMDDHLREIEESRNQKAGV
ncbi:IQ calmodulin-binding motif protein [Lasiodiplodia theobromae]|uniref:IQ calmodulin-binding motif protein n=1 Tax=Lasiodiplodia theobromae TaxID=45133 RepID=UPI0015C2E76D|nr:IQ calmodulin-binding motif protein [Lasiodiplodia theobromae]KAF4537855.1 IQ calmodulin-binding motif protein [Lasiodiplodia theobromae]